MSSVQLQQPRLPPSTKVARAAVYNQAMAYRSLQVIAASLIAVVYQATEDVTLDQVHAIICEDLVGNETLTIDIAIGRINGAVAASVLATPLVLGSGSGSASQQPVALSAAFLATGRLVLAGETLRISRTLAGAPGSAPTNAVTLEIAPAT